MQIGRKLGGKKKYASIGTKGIMSKEEINNSSYDVAWRNNVAGITGRLESEEYLLSGDSLLNIAKILSSESELTLSVLSQYRGDIKQIETGSTSLMNAVDGNTLAELEGFMPITAMTELGASLKRSGVDRQMIDGLVAAKVLYKVVSELEELKKIMIQGYEQGMMDEDLAKEIGVFGFGAIEESQPATTLVSKKGGRFGKNNNEDGQSTFGRKGFGAKEENNSGGFGGGHAFKSKGKGLSFGNVGGGQFSRKGTGTFGNTGGSSFGGKKAGSAFGGGSTFGKKGFGFGK